jgi:1-aminocyclopropane-1-carboxylate deaminase/D-cysteine desulfhydrase-like pyridoxal-dependent ACC family enzyme
MSGTRPSATTGNLLLSELLDARITFTGSGDRADREAAARRVKTDVERAGRTAHFVPVGGSDPAGAVGHALAAAELVGQMRDLGEPLDAIVLATATGGTQAGMLAGLHRIAARVPVYGFAVNKPAAETAAVVRALAAEVARLIGSDNIDSGAVLVDDSQLGPGYGEETAAASKAISTFARAEGILLDPVYTAKALAGLLVMLRASRWQPDRGVVFIHTGGAPVLFT